MYRTPLILPRGIFYAHLEVNACGTGEVFSVLKRKAGNFVNVLSIAEYICAFCLHTRSYRKALDLLFRMSRAGRQWQAVVGNIFAKYDEATEMLLSMDVRELVAAGGVVESVLLSLGKTSTAAIIEACAVLAFRVALPTVVTYGEICSQAEPPLHLVRRDCLFDTDRRGTTRVLGIVARTVLALGVDPTRPAVWELIAKTRAELRSLDLRQMLRRIWDILPDSPRRPRLEAYACNGLLSRDVNVRRVSALILSRTRNSLARGVANVVLSAEEDGDVRFMLGESGN